MRGGAIDLANPITDHPLNQGMVNWWHPLGGEHGTVLFDRRKKQDATLANGTLIVGEPASKAMVFASGSSQYATFGSYAPTANTVSVWVLAKSGADQPIIYNGSDMFNSAFWDWGWFIYFSSVYWQTSASSATQTFITFQNVWKHLVIVRNDGGTARFYVDGIQHSTNTGGTGTSNGPVRIGKAGSNYFNGCIRDFRIYDRTLPADQVFALYSDGLRGLPNTLRRVPTRRWFLADLSAGSAGSGILYTQLERSTRGLNRGMWTGGI